MKKYRVIQWPPVAWARAACAHAAHLAPPYGSHDGDIVKLLASGKNVIGINGYGHPRHRQDSRVAALEAACRKGGSTLTNAGLNPGFAAE